MPGIFISYRRKDTSGHAGHLKADLNRRFGSPNVFMDVDSIPGGVPYEDPINHFLDSCHVSLVLIGEQWLGPTGGQQEAAGPSGEPKTRIDDNEDWVRKEVAAALERSDVKVVPVLVEESRFPDAAELPAEISSLPKIQYCRLRNSQWAYDFDRICEIVESAGSESRLSRFLRRAKSFVDQRRPWVALGGMGVAIAVAALVIVLGAGGGTAAGSCLNQVITEDVRAELSDAADTRKPAIEGSVYYGTCQGQAWALAEFPGAIDGVFKQTGFNWTRLGSISSALCMVPDELLAVWKRDTC